MLEVKIGVKAVDLPYTVRVYDVTEELFDALVDEDTKAELLDGVMIVHSPASLRHEDLASFLGGLMSFYADAQGLGSEKVRLYVKYQEGRERQATQGQFRF